MPAAWAKLVRGCEAANALDKFQTAREANQAHIDAVATFDPAPAATLTAELDRALNPARDETSRPARNHGSGRALGGGVRRNAR